MPGKTEICGNCGEKIGQLETPFVWNNHIVCGHCHAKLAPTIDYATPGAAAPATPALPPRRAVTIEQTGKGYKAIMAMGAVFALIGAVLASAGQPTPGVRILVLGLIIFMAARIGAWWSHG